MSNTTTTLMTVKEKFSVRLYTADYSTFELIKKGFAEMIGTAILVFLGCLGCVGSMGIIPTHLQICFSFGFAVITAVTSVAHISDAHINPAVTLGAVICGRKSFVSALIYFTGQITGGIVGFGLLKIITPQNYLHGGDPDTTLNFCVTMLHPRVTVFQGIFCEVIATVILVFMSCAVSDSCNNDGTSIKFGFTVIVLCLGFVPYTGCSMNPARSFGPALLNNQWSQHWIYWFGPVMGAIIGSLLYKAIFMPKINKKKINTSFKNEL